MEPNVPASLNALLGTERELSAFHAGDRATLERCYRDHFGAVARAAARVLGPVDAETVTHEVFHRLIASADMRTSFRGGDLGAWLSRVATNLAIDYRRRLAREQALPDTLPAPERPTEDEAVAARLLVERFEREVLPPKWRAVFEARFLRQLTQREAASELGVRRTTLLYQEHRIRALLRRFVLREER
jgi:RNA polymerase sigma-70 factor (ECF subfamily)